MDARINLCFEAKGIRVSKILLLNGPNLNMLGSREPSHYGARNLASIEAELQSQASAQNHTLESYQSNAEAELIEHIQQAPAQGIAYILFNPAAFTHTSIALRDALLAAGLPFIEVHVSNIHAREAFRGHSYFSDIAEGVISGLGAQGYRLALDAAMARLAQSS
jgi:3-dehydroquinate dehydratase-2